LIVEFSSNSILVTIKCLSLFTGLTLVHLLLMSFLGDIAFIKRVIALIKSFDYFILLNMLLQSPLNIHEFHIYHLLAFSKLTFEVELLKKYEKKNRGISAFISNICCSLAFIRYG
jgi:uncharacterized radical SAM superfamily protein